MLKSNCHISKFEISVKMKMKIVVLNARSTGGGKKNENARDFAVIRYQCLLICVL